jgi:hypothetical protein
MKNITGSTKLPKLFRGVDKVFSFKLLYMILLNLLEKVFPSEGDVAVHTHYCRVSV